MELRYLESFEAVVRCGGFTKAAADLHIAQPAVSAHIKRLEKELGVTLLHRSQGVTLSAAGEHFLPHVRIALANLQQGQRLMREFQTVETGHVRVAVTPLTGSVDVVDVLRRFRLRYPGVTISLKTGLISVLLKELRDGKVDTVIGPVDDGPESEGLRRFVLESERLVLITPLAGVSRVTSLVDVADQPFVCLAADSGLRRLLDQAFAKFGRTPRVDFETHSPASIRELVSAGLGCGLVAQSVAEEQPGPAVQTFQVLELPEHPPMCVLSGPDCDPTVDRFINEIRAGGTRGK